MAEMWPPSGCLHSPDTWEDEEKKRGEERDRGRELLTAAALETKSPSRRRASGHGHNKLWLTLGFGVVFYEGSLRVLCVDE